MTKNFICADTNKQDNKDLVAKAVKELKITEEQAWHALSRWKKNNRFNPFKPTVKDIQGFVAGETENDNYSKIFDKQQSKQNKKLQLFKELKLNQIDSYVKSLANMYDEKIVQVLEKRQKEESLGNVKRILTGNLWKDKKIIISNIGNKRIWLSIKKDLESYTNKSNVIDKLYNLYLKNGYKDEDALKKATEEATNIANNATNILKYFDILLSMSASILKNTQPVSTMSENIVDVNDNEGADDVEDLEEIAARDDYQKEAFEMSVWSRIDPDIKNILNSIADIQLRENEITTQKDSFGKDKRANPRIIAATLINIVGKCTKPEQMIPALAEQVKTHPWMQQIMDVLLGKNIKLLPYYTENQQRNEIIMQNIQALFWKNFHMPFYTFIGIDINNKTILSTLNKSSAETSLLDNWRESINSGNYNTENTDSVIYINNGILNEEVYNSVINELYSNDGKYYKAKEILRKSNIKYEENIKDTKDYNIDEFITDLRKLLAYVGVEFSENDINIILKNGKLHTIKNLIFGIFKENKNPNKATSIFNQFYTQYSNLAKAASENAEVYEENSFTVRYDNGRDKLIYSHSIPNPIQTMFAELTSDNRKQFIENEFMYDYHYVDSENNLRNPWLKELYESKQTDVEIANLIISLGKDYMQSTEVEQALSQLIAFKSGWYDAGTFADTKANYYVKNKVRTIDECIDGIVNFAEMELDRMVYIKAKHKLMERTKDNNNFSAQEISYYDQAVNFVWLPSLNKKKKEIIKEINAAQGSEKREILTKYVKEALEEEKSLFRKKFKVDLNINIENKNPQIKKILSTLSLKKQEDFDMFLDSYFYNQFLAKECIQNILMVDPAFSKNTTDLQKRFKMFHSPVQKLYTCLYVYDEEGKIVQKNIGGRRDDKGRLIELFLLLEDVNSPSQTNDQYKTALYNLYKSKGLSDNEALSKAKLKAKDYSEICLTDGQAYRMLESWERYLNMAGKGLDMNLHAAISKLKNGKWDWDAFQQVYTVWKPFIATYLNVNNGFIPEDFEKLDTEESKESIERFQTSKVPTQHKNSEFLLLAMYSQVQGCTKQSPKLKALNRFMVDAGIDKAQFVSASKLGIMGAVNINIEIKVVIRDGKLYDANNTNKEIIPDKNHLYIDDNTGKYYGFKNEEIIELTDVDIENQYIRQLSKLTGIPLELQIKNNETMYVAKKIEFKDEYNHSVVQSFPVSDFGHIVEVPEHLLSHDESALGVQVMKLMTENMDSDALISIDIPGLGSSNMTYKEMYNLYQQILWKNIQEGFKKVNATLNNPVKLLDYIHKQLQTQTNIDTSIEESLQLDKNGDFVLSLVNPLRNQKFLKFCASLIRKEMVKQNIKQGQLPQVSAFGMEDMFQQRFQDEDGHMIFTRREFMSDKSSVVMDKRQYKHFMEMRKKYYDIADHIEEFKKSHKEAEKCNDAYDLYMLYEGSKVNRELYMESATPIYDKDLLSAVLLPTGYIDEDLLNFMLDGNARDAIGYRQPTEDLHSIVKLYLKYFMAQQNAGTIVLAPDWVVQSGSDFDVDKLYTMFYNLHVHNTESIILNEVSKANGHKDWSLRQKNIEEAKYSSDLHKIFMAVIKTPNNGEVKLSDELKKYKKELAQIQEKVNKYGKPFVTPLKYNAESTNYNDLLQALDSNNQKQRYNLMLSIYKAVMSNVNSLEQNRTPNGFNEEETLSAIMGVLKTNPNANIEQLLACKSRKEVNSLYTSEEAMSPANPALRTIEQHRNMAGLQLVALGALYRVFNPLLQMTSANVANFESIGSEWYSTKKGDRKIGKYQVIINGNKNCKPLGRLNDIANEQGVYTALYLGEVLAAAVDNGKNPVMGGLEINTKNYPYVAYLLMRGYSMTDVSFFFNQPYIVSIFNEAITNGSSVSSVALNTLRRIVNELRERSKGEDKSKRPIDAFTIDQFATSKYFDMEVHNKNSKSDMSKCIMHGIDHLTDYDLFLQYQAVKYLKNLIEPSDELNTVISICRSFTKSGTLSADEESNAALYAKIEVYKKMVENGVNKIQGLEALAPLFDGENDLDTIKNSIVPSEIGMRYLTAENPKMLLNDISFGTSDFMDNFIQYYVDLTGRQPSKAEIKQMINFAKGYIFSEYVDLTNENNPFRNSIIEICKSYYNTYARILGLEDINFEQMDNGTLKCVFMKSFGNIVNAIKTTENIAKKHNSSDKTLSILDNLSIYPDLEVNAGLTVITSSIKKRSKDDKDTSRMYMNALLNTDGKFSFRMGMIGKNGKTVYPKIELSYKALAEGLFILGMLNNGPTPSYSNILDLFPYGYEASIAGWQEKCYEMTARNTMSMEDVMDLYARNYTSTSKVYETIRIDRLGNVLSRADYQAIASNRPPEVFIASMILSSNPYIRISVPSEYGDTFYCYKYNSMDNSYTIMNTLGLNNVYIEYDKDHPLVAYLSEEAQQTANDKQNTNIEEAEPMTAIKVKQYPISDTESQGGYVQRTKENARWSDITLDFTEDGNPSGGRNGLTAQYSGDKYVGIKIDENSDSEDVAKEILSKIKDKSLPMKNIKLNIAGNGIYELKYKQFAYNSYIQAILSDLLKLGVTISEIRSGGQTGIDEAGIIAGINLGIETSVHAPRGYEMRLENGNDVFGRERFMDRFDISVEKEILDDMSTDELSQQPSDNKDKNDIAKCGIQTKLDF